MGNCKDCKHWGLAMTYANARDCLRIPHGTSRVLDNGDLVVIDDETSATRDYDDPILIQPDGAAACDASGYAAVLNTGPEFGCSLFESKE